ncbi:MAG: LlaJI family restriction endonuclease [Bacteroidales bacterium]|nr:LlaJI family restriction endonuclease [Bacteroidales bacterium]
MLSLLKFDKEHKNLFAYITRLKHSGQNKIHWQKTISKTQALIQNGVPLYIQPQTKQKDINFDEELIVLFYSVLNYLAQEFKFNVRPAFGYDLLKPEIIQSMIDSGKGVRVLRQNRRKYFTDEMVQLWNLLFTFFEQSQYVQSKDNDDEQAMLVREFNLVFEDMIDSLIGDSDIHGGLKEQKDGKIIDHIYRDNSLIEDKKQIYFIGDSKYYKDDNDIGPNSIYKQFTYAKNVIQYNIDFFNRKPEEFKSENLQYRDNTTEGYNITPNFFIRGHLQADQLANYSDANLQLVPFEDKNYRISYHFENRLFDRDTLILQTYNINFLFVLACYVQGAGENTQKIRGIFRDNIKTVLQSQYDFFAIKPKVQDEAETFMHDNFQQILGKVFAPYDVFTNCMALALDNGTDNTDTLDLIDKYFYRKPIPKDQLDINPDTLFTPGEQTTIQATAPTIDLHTKCIITAVVTKGDKQFDKYNIGAATEYRMIKVPKVVNIMSIKYLMPMVGYKLRGYYEVTDIKFDSNTGGVRFKFDKFFPLGDKEVNVAGDMKHGELQNLECIRKLYNKHC